MVADVDAAIARNKGPYKQYDSRPRTESFQDGSEEDGQTKGVGSMGGDETILPARHAFGKVDQILEIRVETRSQSLKNGFADM